MEGAAKRKDKPTTSLNQRTRQGKIGRIFNYGMASLIYFDEMGMESN